ncbi:unnamed protein product [Urochloa humidicola]
MWAHDPRRGCASVWAAWLGAKRRMGRERSRHDLLPVAIQKICEAPNQAITTARPQICPAIVADQGSSTKVSVPAAGCSRGGGSAASSHVDRRQRDPLWPTRGGAATTTGSQVPHCRLLGSCIAAPHHWYYLRPWWTPIHPGQVIKGWGSRHQECE